MRGPPRIFSPRMWHAIILFKVQGVYSWSDHKASEIYLYHEDRDILLSCCRWHGDYLGILEVSVFPCRHHSEHADHSQQNRYQQLRRHLVTVSATFLWNLHMIQKCNPLKCEFPKHVRTKNWKESSPSLDELNISLDYVLGLADRKTKSNSLKATRIPIW